jgi:hypothetical protein
VYRGLIAVRVIRMVSRTWCVRFLFEIRINNSGFKANTARTQINSSNKNSEYCF